MNEYNLSWEEAVKAMKLGAVCDSESYVPHKIIDGEIHLHVFFKDWLPVSQVNRSKPYREDESWRIVNLEGCTFHSFTNEISREISCVVHSKRMCSLRSVPYKKLKSALNAACAEEVTRMAKEKIAKKEVKMVKEYSFEEAFGEGERDTVSYKVITPGHYQDETYYRKLGDIYNNQSNNLSICVQAIIDLAKCKFIKIEVENEVKENGLGLNKGRVIDCDKDYCIEGSKEDDIFKALSIYKQLLSHPLVVKFEEYVWQYIISIHEDITAVYPHSFDGVCSRITRLSPMFNSPENARKAIEDIGQDNLIFMFKTLKGL